MAGLGWWSSLLSAPFLLGGVIGLSLARPRLLLSRIPWMGLAGFLLGSSPFWLWQYLHDFSTFGFFEGHGVGIFNQLPSRIYTVLRFSLFQSLLGDWWDGHTCPSFGSFFSGLDCLHPYLSSGFFHFLNYHFSMAPKDHFPPKPFSRTQRSGGSHFLDPDPGFFHQRTRGQWISPLFIVLYIPFTILVALWLGKIFQFRRALGSAASDRSSVFQPLPSFSLS